MFLGKGSLEGGSVRGEFAYRIDAQSIEKVKASPLVTHKANAILFFLSKGHHLEYSSRPKGSEGKYKTVDVNLNGLNDVLKFMNYAYRKKL